MCGSEEQGALKIIPRWQIEAESLQGGLAAGTQTQSQPSDTSHMARKAALWAAASYLAYRTTSALTTGIMITTIWLEHSEEESLREVWERLGPAHRVDDGWTAGLGVSLSVTGAACTRWLSHVRGYLATK